MRRRPRPKEEPGTLIHAIDPGGEKCGWALVRVDGTRKATFVDAGVCALEMIVFFANHVAIEMPEGYAYSPARGAHLVATARAAGILVGRLIEGNRTVGGDPSTATTIYEMPAAKWRLQVCGRSGAKDGDIAEKVIALVSNLPKRTNPHIRDAIGLALAVGWGLPSSR